MGWGRGRVGQKRGRKKKEIDVGTSDLSSEPTKSGSGEESTIRPEEKEGCGGGGFFACYLLTSLSPRHKGQTYIGFTVNPRRRIRQHNGEISSGAFRTKKKRPWEMVLCIYGFPTNISALQFEWAWQHPKESINVREAAATLKSISGLANKIKLAYKMLNLPAWNSLNMTVNIFSSKYTIHSAGIDLPKHMKSQICSMDELPCFNDENGGGFFDDYNRDELNGEDDEVSDKDDDGNDKDNSPSKTLSSSLCRGEKVWLTGETMFQVSDDDDKHMESQIYSMDELPCYTYENGCGLYDDYNHAELNGEDVDLSDKNETHIREDDDKDNTPSKPLSSSLYRGGKVCLTDETFFDLSDDDDDEKHMKSQNCSLDKFPCYTDVTTAHENGNHDELNGELSPKNETHIREDDDGDTDISSLKISSSTLCEGKKVLLTEETFFELSDDDDDDSRCIIPVVKTHEVDVIDLLSPSPDTCIKKKKTRIMMNVYPHDIIDLTKSPAFV